ncbi:MAG: quinol dehydrogenase ferredoxin subunit NapH [Magnetococcus sp. WYHC-3]
MSATPPGLACSVDAAPQRSFWESNRWLLWRRVSQMLVFLMFWTGPLWGVWIARGNLAASEWFGVVPFNDPYILAQGLAAGHLPENEAWLGVGLLVALYLLLGGRSFCAWICPVNPVSDAAAWLRRRLGISGGWRPQRATRYWVLVLTLLLSALSGQLVWELINPVSLAQRGLIFGMGWAWAALLTVFLWDLFISPEGWCGRLCPHGAFLSLLSPLARLRVHARRREACDDCNDCFAVCPEPRIIKPALKAVKDHGPVIDAIACTNCGRCIDMCNQKVFEFSVHSDKKEKVAL